MQIKPLNANLFEDNTATLIVRQGQLLYSVGTDLDLNGGLVYSLRRVGLLGLSAQNTILRQILEKTPEEAETILHEIDTSTRS